MKTLYGTPRIEHTSSLNGYPVGDFVEIASPKAGTSTLDSPEGTENELKNEKGKVIDSYTEPANSKLTFELVKEKGKSLPWPAKNGAIPGEHAFRVSNLNDPNCPAVQLDRCTLTSRILWSKGDALRVAYNAKVLEPAEGNDVKILGVDVDKDSLSFTAAADDTGKDVNVEGGRHHHRHLQRIVGNRHRGRQRCDRQGRCQQHLRRPHRHRHHHRRHRLQHRCGSRADRRSLTAGHTITAAPSGCGSSPSL